MKVISGDITDVRVECITADVITRVSVASDGTEGDNWSTVSAVSNDGRYVAFDSSASNLVAGDTNFYWDSFVHDRLTGETTRVSVASDGTEGNYGSGLPTISGDGRYVAFNSNSINLVADDTNLTGDVFVHDRLTGETKRVSVTSDGSEGNGDSSYSAISNNGRYVAFSSQASNLVTGDTNGRQDVFVHDRLTGETTRVSVASNGTEDNFGSTSPSISGDGRYVAFTSGAPNFVTGDNNGMIDVFVHDRQTAEITRVSVASDGTEGNYGGRSPTMSGNGRYVAFSSRSTNLVEGDTNGHWDVFVHDRETGETTRVSVASDGTEGNDDSCPFPGGGLFISGNGRYVAFDSLASNLVAGDTNSSRDIFVHDRQTGETARVNVASGGTEGNLDSYFPSISGDGRYVAFRSSASNLVAGDTNGLDDVFVAPVQ